MSLDLSIIIPTKNVVHYIYECLQSIAAQGLEYSRFEVIVVDAMSTDGTIAVIDDFRSILPIKLIQGTDKCQAEAVNRGLLAASGSILHWHAADDLVLPAAFNTVLAAFEDKSVDLVFSDGVAFDAKNVFLMPPAIGIRSELILLYRHRWFRFQSDTAYFRKEIILRSGLVREEIPVWCDEEFFLRLCAFGSFRRLCVPLGAFRIRRGQVSEILSDVARVKRERLEYRRKLWKALGWSTMHVVLKRARWFIPMLILLTRMHLGRLTRKLSRLSTQSFERNLCESLLHTWIACLKQSHNKDCAKVCVREEMRER